MRIVEQSYDIIAHPLLAEGHIATCGHTAYQVKDSKTSDEDFCRNLIAKGHESVIEHAVMTVKFITDRGVSHELVRHRLASFTQESTRYCNYDSKRFDNQITVIQPIGIDSHEDVRAWHAWYCACRAAEDAYFALINANYTPQVARSVLPTCLKTEIVMTANFREWRHVFKERALNTAAHPQMRDLMIPLYEAMRVAYPSIFDMGAVAI